MGDKREEGRHTYAASKRAFNAGSLDDTDRVSGFTPNLLLTHIQGLIGSFVPSGGGTKFQRELQINLSGTDPTNELARVYESFNQMLRTIGFVIEGNPPTINAIKDREPEKGMSPANFSIRV